MSHERRTGRWWRDRFMATHYAKLKSAEVLVGFMIHKGFVEQDAYGKPLYVKGKAQLQYSRFAGLVKIARSDIAGEEKTVSRQMITQLCTGVRNSCTTDLGLAIERVLDVPEQMIFDVLPKSLEKRDIHKRQAA